MNANFFDKLFRRLPPQFIWWIYSQKSRFLRKSYFILSFDCDTEDDIRVGLSVHEKLQDIGITPVYAVPGALLIKGAKAYQKIYSTGAEFINHGGREHTYFDEINNRYASNFFYDQQSYDVLKEDILLGHKTLQNVLGVTPLGWRTPHFGTFQKKLHLDFLYKILAELNYQFSTSTLPSRAYRYGAIYTQKNILEIPVTGVYSEPLNIFDTWGYFESPHRTKSSDNYLDEMCNLCALAMKRPILINIYGDPSHIHNKPEFFQAMKNLVSTAQNVNYIQFLREYNENVRSVL